MSRPSVTNRAYTSISELIAFDPALHLQRVFVYFLQNLFRNAPEGTGLRWHSNLEQTELIISGEKPVLSVIEKKPHICCILGAGRWAGTSLDQLKSLRFSDGSRQHTDLMPFTMAYHCQAKNGVTARRTALVSSLMTNVFRRTIHRAGGIHNVDVRHELSAESPPTAFTGPTAKTDAVSVVVTVPFYWQVQWRITEPAELWRQVRVQLAVMEKQAEGKSGEVRFEDGRPVGIEQVIITPEEAFRQVIYDSSLDE